MNGFGNTLSATRLNARRPTAAPPRPDLVLSHAIQVAHRALYREWVGSDLAFAEILKLRDSPGLDQAASLALLDRAARLRHELVRLKSRPGAGRPAELLEALVECLFALNLHPRQLREIDTKLSHALSPSARQAFRRLEEAKAAMVRENMGLVEALAPRYLHRGLDWSDLLQEGALGLMRAVEKFDPERGFRFSTYAHWWIRQAMTRAIADHGRTVRVPVHLSEQLSRVRRTSQKLAHTLGREPTLLELSEAAHLSLEKVAHALGQERAPLSLDAPVGPEGETSLLEQLPNATSPDPASEFDQAELKQHLEAAVSCLPPREQCVLRFRFGVGTAGPRTLEEIGRLLGVTRERVRQIEAAALRRLSRKSRTGHLESFLS